MTEFADLNRITIKKKETSPWKIRDRESYRPSVSIIDFSHNLTPHANDPLFNGKHLLTQIS